MDIDADDQRQLLDPQHLEHQRRRAGGEQQRRAPRDARRG